MGFSSSSSPRLFFSPWGFMLDSRGAQQAAQHPHMQTPLFSELAGSLGSLLCCTNLTLKGSRALQGCEETAQQDPGRGMHTQKLKP